MGCRQWSCPTPTGLDLNMQKLLAALFAALLMLGGVACTVDADDEDGTEAEVEVDAEEEVEVEEEPVEGES